MCRMGTEMNNLRLGFRAQIGRGNTERDVMYAQLYLDASRALASHRAQCPVCGAATRDQRTAA